MKSLHISPYYLNGDETRSYFEVYPENKTLYKVMTNPEIHHFTHWLQSVLNQILFHWHWKASQIFGNQGVL